jgi:hypothetical protein
MTLYLLKALLQSIFASCGGKLPHQRPERSLMTKQEEIEAAFNDANIPRKLWFTKLGYYKLYGEYRFLYAHYLQLIALTSFVVVCYFLVRKTFLVFNLNMGGLHIYKREFAMSTKKLLVTHV